MSLQAVAAASYAANVLLFTRTFTHSHVLGFCSFEVYNLDLVFDTFSGMLVCLCVPILSEPFKGGVSNSFHNAGDIQPTLILNFPLCQRKEV